LKPRGPRLSFTTAHASGTGIAGEDARCPRSLSSEISRIKILFAIGLPNLEDQTKLFALLHPEENVGVR